MTASTLLQRQVLSRELFTVQTGAGKIVPARKFKCTTGARDPLGLMHKIQNNPLQKFIFYQG